MNLNEESEREYDCINHEADLREDMIASEMYISGCSYNEAVAALARYESNPSSEELPF